VVAAVLGTFARHVRPAHREQAQQRLDDLLR
jgi:hypothetical protein